MTTQPAFKLRLPYKAEFKLAERKEAVAKAQSKFPNKVPVILEKVQGSDIPDMEERKFLVHKDHTIGQFMYSIRRHYKLRPEQAMYFFVHKKTFLSPSLIMSQAYKEHKDAEDGFLYIRYAAEETFGSGRSAAF